MEKSVSIWDERKLAKSLRIVAKELSYLREDVKRYSNQLSVVDGDGERAESQRERGESWGEVADTLDTMLEELDGALDGVEGML